MGEDIAIRVEHLSKSFRIAQRRRRTGFATYTRFSEELTDWVKKPLRHARSLFSGQNPSATATHEDFCAIDDVSFDVRQGEVIGIVGRNGAGKSTLLKILSRISEPTLGRIEINGRVASLLEVGTGFHPELTGRENIFLNGAILGMNKAEIRRRFDEIVAFAEVERFVDTPVKRYSSGMYLRLAFAVAAHLEPEILIVDEVLAVGDLSFQNKCLSKLQDVSGSGRTVLFVSHNMTAIHRLCSRCLLLHQGRIIENGPTNQVIQTYVSLGLVERPEYIHNPDPTRPAVLRRIAMQGAGGVVTNSFRYDQGFGVEIEYEINQAVTECSVWVGVRTAEGASAFDTADTDTTPTLLLRREPGFYRATVDLPPNWLNAGSYYLVVGIVLYRNSVDRVEFGAFTVSDIGTPEKGRQGILQPFLPWQTSPANIRLKAEGRT